MKEPLIRNLNIAHFRGLNALSLDNLSHINVLAGANNSGKTSVLEAAFLLSAPNSFRAVAEIALGRVLPSAEQEADSRIEYVLSMFHQQGGTYLVDVSAEKGAGSYQYQISGKLGKKNASFLRNAEVLRLTAKNLRTETSFILWKANIENGDNYTFDKDYRDSEDDGGGSDVGYYKHFAKAKYEFYDAFYVPSTKINYYRIASSMMLNMARQGKMPDILNVMRIFDPDIENISVFGRDAFVTHKRNRTLPLYAYGDGLQKAAALAPMTINMQDGVLLIDEIENAIHISAFEEVFRWFIGACLDYHVQAFLTTHSAEALDAIIRVAHDHFKEEDILRVITLRKDTDANVTRRLIRTGEEAYQDRERFEEELRV